MVYLTAAITSSIKTGSFMFLTPQNAGNRYRPLLIHGPDYNPPHAT